MHWPKVRQFCVLNHFAGCRRRIAKREIQKRKILIMEENKNKQKKTDERGPSKSYVNIILWPKFLSRLPIRTYLPCMLLFLYILACGVLINVLFLIRNFWLIRSWLLICFIICYFNISIAMREQDPTNASFETWIFSLMPVFHLCSDNSREKIINYKNTSPWFVIRNFGNSFY